MPFTLVKLQTGKPLQREILAPAVLDSALQNVQNVDIAALRYRAEWSRQDFVAIADYMNKKIDTAQAVIVVEDQVFPYPPSSGILTTGVLRSSRDPLHNR